MRNMCRWLFVVMCITAVSLSAVSLFAQETNPDMQGEKSVQAVQDQMSTSAGVDGQEAEIAGQGNMLDSAGSPDPKEALPTPDMAEKSPELTGDPVEPNMAEEMPNSGNDSLSE